MQLISIKLDITFFLSCGRRRESAFKVCVNGQNVSVCSLVKTQPLLSVRLEDGPFSVGNANTEAVKVEDD